MLSSGFRCVAHCRASLLGSMRAMSSSTSSSPLIKKELHSDDKIVRLVLNDSKRRLVSFC